MSALVDEAIQLCRAKELKVCETIRQYKDILRSMKTRVKDSSEAETPTSVKASDITLNERQEVELLEQVLKKALKIRSRSAVGLNYQEETCSSASDDKAPAVKDSFKRKSQISSSGVKGHPQPVGHVSTSGRGDVATHQILFKTGLSSRPTIKGKQSGERTSKSDHELKIQDDPSASKTQWMPSPSLELWQVQQARKNKLWNKVLTRHSKPVPERDLFTTRLVSSFPSEWISVHNAAMEAELDVLTQLGLDLTHCYNAILQSHQLGWNPEPSTEKEYESLSMLAGLEETMVQVTEKVSHLKKDWERKMAYWHGALCPLRSKVVYHQPCLPPIVTYSSRHEFEDLHNLRLHVAQLKLEIYMHQAVCDALMNLISCESSSSGHPSATVLRGVYSLLGEGGAQFPSLVLDID